MMRNNAPAPILSFRQLPEPFAVCRLSPGSPVPEMLPGGPFTSVTRTGDELSIVCRLEDAPPQAKIEQPWTCLQLLGPFPFTQTGVLASAIGPLAEAGISIFAISTFDTDYVLVKQEAVEHALQVLREAGYQLRG